MKLFLLAFGLQANASNSCQDKFVKCPDFASSCDLSVKLQDLCPKTCGTCSELSARSSMSFEECKDDYAVCDNISQSQCSDNSIRAACRETCNSCNDKIRQEDNTCQEASWCQNIFRGHCMEPTMADEKARYGKYCPIQCQHPSCAFEWGAKMDSTKKDIDGCQDVSKICLELVETVPGICNAKQSLMTHFCQKTCNRCGVIVADTEQIEKLECQDFRTNCNQQNLLEKKLGLPIKECQPPSQNEPLLVKQRKLKFQGLCRKTCNQCDDVIFQGNEAEKPYHDPICGSVYAPDCKHLEPICKSEPFRCVFGCTLCKKPRDLLDLIIPNQYRKVCEDKKQTCPKWRCKNKKYAVWMKKYCAKTCGAC